MLVWNLEGADIEFREKRERKINKKKDMLIDSKPEACLVHVPCYCVGGAETFHII